MQNIIIGTAGHVDHGKTCLIKALTGIDTDRLKEEKKRGITIENGFAYMPNDIGYHIGIIDVPGHEKFVKNMLAGIGGIDLTLLVISLEEGIKPQTIEHFEILKTIGIRKGIVVFTKLDSENKVDFENLRVALHDLTKGSFLEGAKEICVSSYTGQNIDLLKELILESVKSIGERNNNKALTRLPIDRVFTMEGFGTVITGTLIEGKIDTGDELMVYPSQKIVKVRQLQSHGKAEPSAFAGQRTAINLLNVKKEELDRGDVIAAKSSMIPSEIIDCKLTMFKTASRKIKNGERILFNYGSNQVTASVKVISNEYIQLKFDNPIPVKRGDRYIVRFLSPTETCGGGVILNIDSKRYKVDDGTATSHFKAIDSNDEKVVLEEIISDGSANFPNVTFVAKKMNQATNDTISLISKLKDDNKAVVINGDKSDNITENSIVISIKFYDGIKKYILDILNKYHKTNNLSKGMKKEELKSILFKRYSKVGDTVFEKVLNYLIYKGVIRQVDDLIADANFKVVIDDKVSDAITNVEKKYLEAKFEPPDNKTLIEMCVNDKFNDRLKLRQVMLDLAKEGKLVKLSTDYYIHRKYFDKAVLKVKEFFKTSDKMAMTDLRDMLATSRKYAILIIDYMDKIRLTELHGLYRVKGANYGKV